MPWLDADDPPDPARWIAVRCIAPGEATPTRGYQCRACGWIALRRSLPTGHECAGRRRGWGKEAVPRGQR